MTRRLLFIDHQDSFGGNLVAWFRAAGFDVQVCVVDKNGPLDQRVPEIALYDGCLLSPGPGHPGEYEWSQDFYRRLPAGIPCFGVCLGLQIMLNSSGVKIDRVPQQPPVHGRRVTIDCVAESRLLNDGRIQGEFVLFNSLGARWHDSELKPDWTVLAVAEQCVMAVEHSKQPHFGVQFHPESFASRDGNRLLSQIRWRAP